MTVDAFTENLCDVVRARHASVVRRAAFGDVGFRRITTRETEPFV